MITEVGSKGLLNDRSAIGALFSADVSQEKAEVGVYLGSH